MSGFIYGGYSTSNIISEELVLCTMTSIDSVVGVQRDNQAGEITITRPIPNEYGTTSQKLQFEYGLTKKCSDNIFTYEEQRKIERWLTSPKFSQDLQVIDDDGNIVVTYCGKFINTNWYPRADGFISMTFTFENNTAYAKNPVVFKYETDRTEEVPDEDEITEENEAEYIRTFTVDCETDELEEYVYPVITIKNYNSTRNITITNVTDNNNSVTIKAFRRLPIIFDCRHCILKDGTTSSVIRFDTIGWSDVGNIYWPRLLPGENVFTISRPADVTIAYDDVYKRVGGWL